jgi:hypothetical protein
VSIPYSSIDQRGSRVPYQLTLNYIEATLATTDDVSSALRTIRESNYVVHGLPRNYRKFVRHVVDRKERSLRMPKRKPSVKREFTPAVASALKRLVTVRRKAWEEGRLTTVSSDDADRELTKRIHSIQARLNTLEPNRK